MRKNLILFVVSIIAILFCDGCIATVKYFTHIPTDKYLDSTNGFVTISDFNELNDFIRNGVLFIPAFKRLR